MHNVIICIEWAIGISGFTSAFQFLYAALTSGESNDLSIPLMLSGIVSLSVFFLMITALVLIKAVS